MIAFFTVFPGDNHQQVAFVGVTFLIVFPAAGKEKNRNPFPSEKAVRRKLLSRHAGSINRLPVTAEQVVAQVFQIAVMGSSVPELPGHGRSQRYLY